MSLAPKNSGLEALMSRPLSEGDIEQATADMAQPLELAHGRRRSVLLFACAAERLAVPAVDVAKVVSAAPVHRIPHRSSRVLRGLCNTDGELLLCMDLEAALGLPAAEPRVRRMQVVVGSVRDRWAFLVDRVHGVIEVSESAMRPPPVTVGASAHGCVQSLVDTPEGSASLLDLARLGEIFRGAVS